LIARGRLDRRWLLEALMKLATNQIDLDLLMLGAVIAHSQIVVTLPTSIRPSLPAHFDDVDIAVLEWIAVEARRIQYHLAI
jgi:hypothetical protein